MTGKGHFGSSGQQTTVAAVVVGQDQAFGAQGVHRRHQRLQVLGVVQIGHHIKTGATSIAQHLLQNRAAHAFGALAQVDQQQTGVGLLRIQLGRKRAAHIVNAGKSGDDQAHR